MKRCLPAALCTLFLLAAAARPAPPRFVHLSVEDGLSHASVWDIHQDGRGFLWIGTQDGLNRYDGYCFEVYKHDPEATTPDADNRVFFMRLSFEDTECPSTTKIFSGELTLALLDHTQIVVQF